MKLLGLILLSVCTCAKGNWWSLTWDAEGNDNPASIYFSRRLHVPSQRSGLTLGRGYDMKEKSQNMIRNDLLNAGISKQYADIICKAAGLSGGNAKQFIKNHKLEKYVISPSQQSKLFQISLSRKIATAKRICTKSDVVKVYGRADFDKLHWAIKGLIVDLLYRGDYSPTTRKFLQKPIVKNDVKKLAELMSNRSLWSSVPLDRFNRRKKYMQGAV